MILFLLASLLVDDEECKLKSFPQIFRIFHVCDLCAYQFVNYDTGSLYCIALVDIFISSGGLCSSGH